MLTRRQFLSSAVILAAHGIVRPRLAWSAPENKKGAAAAPIRIGYFTDLHARTEKNVPDALAAAAKSIRAANAQILIGGGDFVQAGLDVTAAEAAPLWDLIKKFNTDIGAPYHSVIGNHDLIKWQPADPSSEKPSLQLDPRSDYRRMFGRTQTYYSVDQLGYHLMCLDSLDVDEHNSKFRGLIDPKQMGWIETDLAQIPKDMPIVVVTHIPLLTACFSAEKGGTVAVPQNQVVINNREVLKLFKEHNLLLVLQGHTHVNEVIQWRGTTFLTGGAICGGWWKGDWYGTNEGFGVVTIMDGKINWAYQDYGWHVGSGKPGASAVAPADSDIKYE